MRDDDWYKPHPNRPVPPPRQPRPGREIWRLKDPASGRVQSCQIRDDTRAGGGFDVLMLEGDGFVFSRRYETERHARYVADVIKQDTMRWGWTEDHPLPNDLRG